MKIKGVIEDLFSKTMGCFSGCLMSSAGIQKLFCGIYWVFKCSFDEFVGKKVVSPSYSSAILGPPPVLQFHLSRLTNSLLPARLASWFMGLQRVGHDWATELNWTELYIILSEKISVWISVILWYNKKYSLVFQTLVISWVAGVSGGCSIMYLKPLSTISECMLMRRLLVGA